MSNLISQPVGFSTGKSLCLGLINQPSLPFWPATPEEIYGVILLAIFALIALTVAIFRISTSSQSWSPWALFFIAQIIVVWMWRVRTNKPCPFPATGPAILIANHRSPVDPWLICTNFHLGIPRRMFRMVSFLMAEEYYGIPGVAWVCRTMDCIPIARKGRDMTGVKECLNKLKEGKLVGIFPEGRINTGEGLLPFGTGIAWLAIKAQVPVYPVFIHNSPTGDSMVAPFITHSRATLTYGDPIDLSPYYGDQKNKETLETVVNLLHDKLGSLENQKRETNTSKIKFPKSA